MPCAGTLCIGQLVATAKALIFPLAGDMTAYADDCLFADPFAGFNGVERFKKNVSNLGGLM